MVGLKMCTRTLTLKKRAALRADTSLEILRQKKANLIKRLGGRVFARRFVAQQVGQVLQDLSSYVIVVKCVDVEGIRQRFVSFLGAECVSDSLTILPITNVKELYGVLERGNDWNWLLPQLASSSVCLIVVPTLESLLMALSVCIKFEAAPENLFFEILFLKEASNFINFNRTTGGAEAAELRHLYGFRTRQDILLELNLCLFRVPANLNSLFSISLVTTPSSFYPLSFTPTGGRLL